MSATPRGNHFKFTATFTDTEGNPAEPVSADLRVVYVLNNLQAVDVVPMTVTADPSVWEATWNSRGTQVAPVDWSAEALDVNGRYLVVDGSIDLSGNLANQQGVHA